MFSGLFGFGNGNKTSNNRLQLREKNQPQVKIVIQNAYNI